MKKFTIEMRWHRAKVQLFNIAIHRRINLPDAIGMETSTACNRRCVYCPQSILPQKQKLIEERMWRIFIFRLKELRWKGLTAITKYNEPSLHPDSVRFVSDLRQIGCRPMIFTNGDRPNVIEDWVLAGARRIIITEHPPFRDGWRDKIEPLSEKYPKVIKLSRLSTIYNQAGLVIGEKMERCYSAHGLSVNIDGSVSMCCVDYKSENLIGHIEKESLQEIWDSPKHVDIRRKVIRGIPATKLCRECLV